MRPLTPVNPGSAPPSPAARARLPRAGRGQPDRASTNSAGARTFRCRDCGFPETVYHGDPMPRCPCCGGSFGSASLFVETDTRGWLVPAAPGEAASVDELRPGIAAPGQYLAFRTGGGDRVLAIPQGILRLGRSPRADVHLDDTTVSRRHAVVHREGDRVTLVEDHSLNGVYVNGERVDWRILQDGDEIALGACRLRFVEVAEGATTGSDA